MRISLKSITEFSLSDHVIQSIRSRYFKREANYYLEVSFLQDKSFLTFLNDSPFKVILSA